MYMGIYMCVLYLKHRMIFVLFPASFVISLARNLLLDLTLEHFLKSGIFPGESSSPHRGTETGCIN